MNLVPIGILILYVVHDMILFLEFLTFFIYSRKVVLSNQRHDVTSDDTENLLPYRDILREGETEVHKGDTDLKEFFEYVAQSEPLSLPPGSWNGGKESFVKVVRLYI